MSVSSPDGANEPGDVGEPHFRTVVQYASDIITILDADGIVRYESPAVQHVLGYHPDELVGTDPFALIHPDDVASIRDLFQEVVRHEGMSTSARFRFQHKDGSWLWLDVIGTNLLGDPGVRGVVVSSRASAERQRAEDQLRDSEQRYRNLHADIQRQAQERDLLDEVRTALAHELELPDLFRTVVEAIAQTFGYAFVSLYMLEDDVLVLQHHVGYEGVFERIPVTEGVIGRVVRTGEAVLLADVRTDADYIGTIPDIVSEVCVPLCDQGQAVGALNLESLHGVHLGDDDLRLMMALSDHINIAIGRARLYTAVRQSEARFRALVQHSADVIIVLDADGTRHYISPSVERVLGYRPEELIGHHATDLRHPDDQAQSRAFFAEVVAHPGAHHVAEWRVGRRDGTWGWFEMTATNQLDDPNVEGIVVNARDITERKAAEDALRQSERGLAEAQRLAHIGSWEWDIGSNHVTWTAELYRIMGTTPEAFAASYEGYLAHVHPEDRLRVQGIIGQALADRQHFEFEHRMVGTDGVVNIIFALGMPVFDAGGHHVGFRGTAQNISDRKRLEAALRYQAYHDSLTDLPNRLDFIHRLEDTLATASQGNHTVAVLFLDLDRFKVVNDSLGHMAGDQVLGAVATRLTSILRDANATVARFGGDEFAVLLTGEMLPDEVERVVYLILVAFDLPFGIDGRELFITASIGLAFRSATLTTAMHLVQAADVAMYHAKTIGPGGYAVFDPAMNARAVEHLELESDLQRAAEHNELVLHYQPKVDLVTGAIVALEALLRWHHPRHGLLYPGDFLDLAEETGLIVPLGRWALTEACRQAVAWRTAIAGVASCLMCVNVSAPEFRQPDLIAQVAQILAETGLPPEALELEITEKVAVDDDQALDILSQLKATGVHLALDDFGTGLSPLSALRRLPIDALKIDRSFVQDMVTDRRTRAVVQAVTVLAHELGMQVVAEGVETKAQFESVRCLGIDIVQGTYYAQALPAEECLAYVTAMGIR